jgi:prepilin-type N-terminal cleavage/methylation domain-containing protein
MKTQTQSPYASARRLSRGVRAFTLTEVLVASAVFTMALAGVVAANVFGLRLFELSKAKMGASDDARQAISLMVSEIRSCDHVRVGSYDGTTFTEAGVNTEQKGNAVQIEPIMTNSATFIWYYWATNAGGEKSLNRRVNNSSQVMIIANSVSNQVVFTSEHYDGTPQTNSYDNRVINMTLRFYQLVDPSVIIGPGGLFDYYQLSTKITKRRLN